MTPLKKNARPSIAGRLNAAFYRPGSVLAFLALAVLTVAASGYAQAGEPDRPLILKPVEIRAFAAPPPPVDLKVRPAFKEKFFPLRQAANLAEAEALLGRLNPAQATFLEKNRFLLLPKDALRKFEGADYGPGRDEMLYNFDIMGEAQGFFNRNSEVYSQYQLARFVGPDVFLQALHLYFSERLKALEGGRFRDDTILLLTSLYENAKKLRAESSGQGAKDWERFMSQMLVPLILINNLGPQDEDEDCGYACAFEDPNLQKDTLDQALKLFEAYRPDFELQSAEDIRVELEKVYKAEGMGDNLLGLKPAYNSESVDYSQFRPRGHYNLKIRSRAYFRAMIWLGQLGWSLSNEKGLTDAFNFALAMSLEVNGDPVAPASDEKEPHGEESNENGREGQSAYKAPTTAPAAWAELMELSSFFVGYPDQISYLEWQPFLAEGTKGLALKADSGTDKALIEKLAPKIPGLKPSIQPFADFQGGGSPAVLCVFPQRFTVPWLIAEELTWGPGPNADIPAMFSALWVPALLGDKYARGLMPEQMALNLAGLNNTDEEGRPLETKPDPVEVGPQELKKAVTAMTGLMDGLKARLDGEPESSWFSSIGAAWLRIFSSLTAEYGPGYPLYMQSRAFSAKQMETLLASYTELKHDTILYEKPNYAEMGGGGPEPLPLLKGLVEPNLDFWAAMIRTSRYIHDGFEFYDLFPLDREEHGNLSRFRATLEHCAEIARRELAGEALSEDDYVFIRDFYLDYMSYPPEPTWGGIITEEQFQSGLVVDIQTANLNDEERPSTIVYNGLGEPYLMLVLAGNENSPRLTVGLAFNHYEFVSPYGPRLTDEIWKKRVYGHYGSEDDDQNEEGDQDKQDESLTKAAPLEFPGQANLPPKNFWYDALRP